MKLSRKPLRVLLVEDSPDDAELILFELSEGGFDVECTRIETEAAMRAALSEKNWDIVISDFNLPKFSTLTAMSVLSKSGTDIPFIIVSGCIGEEAAIALMKEGASDFVMKDKLARLPPVVERELREAAMRLEHRMSHKALLESEKLLKEITSALGEGVFVMNTDRKLVFMNPEAERLLGWTQSELTDMDMYHVIYSKEVNRTSSYKASCLLNSIFREGEVCRSEEDVFWRKDGSPMPVSIAVSTIIKDGKATATVVAFQDVSQRKQTEFEILESRAQLRELSSYLQNVREEERTRIARELHDELGQMLTGVKLDAKWLASNISGDRLEIENKITTMSQLIDKTLDAMRRVAADLRPVMLDDLGLISAVEWVTEEFGKRSDIKIQFVQEQCDLLEDVDFVLDNEVATTTFRIIQECLTNISRHAEAKQVQVFMKCIDNNILLMVKDDGKGITEVQEKGRASYGIIGMRERALSIGGTLTITSSPSKGTCVEAVLPIKSASYDRVVG